MSVTGVGSAGDPTERLGSLRLPQKATDDHLYTFITLQIVTSTIFDVMKKHHRPRWNVFGRGAFAPDAHEHHEQLVGT